VDPVSHVLEERRRLERSYLPYVVLALFLHGAVVIGVAVAARFSPHRPIHLPSVSVRLVRMPSPGRKASRAPRAAAPRPTAVPQPKPSPPPKVEEHRPQPSRRQASAEAMPARRATPAPTPAVEEPSGGGRGLSLAQGASEGSIGIPSDFHFTYYVQRMLALIEARWYKPPVPAGTTALVRFSILRGGRVVDIAIEDSSGIPSFDRAALRAMYAANPLPPLPPAYGPSSLTVHLAFTE